MWVLQKQLKALTGAVFLPSQLLHEPEALLNDMLTIESLAQLIQEDHE